MRSRTSRAAPAKSARLRYPPPRAELREGDMSGAPPELLRDRLRSRRPYWIATKHQIGVVCALTLSILKDWYRLGWDKATGAPAPGSFPNAKSAFSAPDCVSAAVAEGVNQTQPWHDGLLLQRAFATPCCRTMCAAACASRSREARHNECSSRATLAPPPSHGGRQCHAAAPAAFVVRLREAGAMRAARALFSLPPSHRWGKAAPRRRTVCAAARALQSRELDTLRAARGGAAPRGSTMCGAACASQSRKSGTMRAARARHAHCVPLALRRCPPPSRRWGRAAPRGRTSCVAACASRAREAGTMRAARAPPPAAAGEGQRTAAAPCTPPRASSDRAR